MKDIKSKIIPILKKYGVKKAALFGSQARGESHRESDVDILIEPPQGMGLSFVSLKLTLEETLGKEVDLVSYKAIHPLLREGILKQQQILL